MEIVIWIAISTSPLKDADGRIQVYGASTDYKGLVEWMWEKHPELGVALDFYTVQSTLDFNVGVLFAEEKSQT